MSWRLIISTLALAMGLHISSSAIAQNDDLEVESEAEAPAPTPDKGLAMPELPSLQHDGVYFIRGFSFTVGFVSSLPTEASVRVDGVDSKLSVPNSGTPFSFGLRFDRVARDGFGWNFGIRGDATPFGDQKLTNFTFRSPFLPLVKILELNITHSLDGAYIFFGANYEFSTYQSNVNTYFGNQFGLGWDWGNNISNIVFSRSRLAFEFIVGYTPWGIRRPNAATGEASEAYARFSTAGVRLVIN